jgi:hypothetical protein
MQVTNPFAHLIQQPRRMQGRHRFGRDLPQCCARLRRAMVSLWHRIVLAAARQSPNLCGADMAGTVSVTAAALRIDLVPYKATVKRHFVQRHQALAHAKAAVVMQRRAELFGKACWISY